MNAKSVSDILSRLLTASDEERRQLLNSIRPMLEKDEAQQELKVNKIGTLVLYSVLPSFLGIF